MSFMMSDLSGQPSALGLPQSERDTNNIRMEQVQRLLKDKEVMQATGYNTVVVGLLFSEPLTCLF
jgi:hypothetical protein